MSATTHTHTHTFTPQKVLIATDVRATARLIQMDFPLELAEVTYKLQANPEVQFEFLQGMFDPK